VKLSIEANNNDIFASFLSSCYNFKYFIYPDEAPSPGPKLPNIPYNKLSTAEKATVLDRVITIKNDFQNGLNMSREYKKYITSNINSYSTEWFRKYVYSMACILFFFIGAPLGSIIRKGGIGIPLVITVAFFSSYFMLTIFGEKIAKGGAVPVWFGMWLSTFILVPICAFLTYQASVDSALLSSEELHKKVQQIKLKKIFARKKNESTPNYP
jgi:lipopolysaccharide export system permease protein